MANKLAKICRWLLAGLLLIALNACGETEFTHSNHPVSFVFDTRLHTHSPALASALNGLGVFVTVSEVNNAGQPAYRFDNHQGLVNVIPLNATDERQTRLIGQNNALIIGYGNLDTPAPFYAYDGECPHCFNFNAIPLKSSPLSVANNGIASCKNCGRRFNLNTGGNMIAGEGRYRLAVYRASYLNNAVVVVKN